MGIRIDTPLGELCLDDPEHWEVFQEAWAALQTEGADSRDLPVYLAEVLRERFAVFPKVLQLKAAIEAYKVEDGWCRLNRESLGNASGLEWKEAMALRAGLVMLELIEVELDPFRPQVDTAIRYRWAGGEGA